MPTIKMASIICRKNLFLKIPVIFFTRVFIQNSYTRTNIDKKGRCYNEQRPNSMRMEWSFPEIS